MTRTLRIDPANAGVRLRRVLDQSQSPQRATVLVDGVAAATWYDPDCNSWKKLAESEVELPVALVRGRESIRVTFQPVERVWTIGELRAFSHVDQPLTATSPASANRSRFSR